MTVLAYDDEFAAAVALENLGVGVAGGVSGGAARFASVLGVTGGASNGVPERTERARASRNAGERSDGATWTQREK